ncbi:MAG: zf-TFIIB domain-containing protein [Elusimicrobia bacterium]|nr:zf-TFIIB domain-containing protein [Elusimicrobiota bacterium]
MVLNCPNCRHALRQVIYEGVVIETCDHCQGEWVDHSEIERINQARDVIFSLKEAAVIPGAKKSVPGTIASRDKALSCPHCQIPLRVINYAYDSGVMVDKCPQCGGFWLDKGELESIQMIVETWEARDSEIKARFAPVLSRIREDVRQGVQDGRPRGNFIKAFLYDIIQDK